VKNDQIDSIGKAKASISDIMNKMLMHAWAKIEKDPEFNQIFEEYTSQIVIYGEAEYPEAKINALLNRVMK
jgi:hypothetical protein